jgi:hypothetical protein
LFQQRRNLDARGAQFRRGSGFNTAWALANAGTSWLLTGLGGLFAPGNNALGFGEGGTFRSASRTGTVSP